MKRKAFTLIEMMIVVSILGIIGAIVFPLFQDNTQRAKESAAISALQIVRSQIEMYKLNHGGVAPGYVGSTPVTGVTLTNQFVGTTAANGMASASKVPSGVYIYGPYMDKLPSNPFNNLTTITSVPSASAFSSYANGTSSGWLYKKETTEFKLNWPGTDLLGVDYVDY